MAVRGLSERTRTSYLRNVELLVRRIGKHPSQLTDDDLRDYFAWLIDERHAAPATYRQHLAAANLFFESVLGRTERFFTTARPKNRQILPVVLTVEETRRLLGALRVARLRVAATVAYCCGLRKSELASLAIDWINAGAGSLQVRDGKGGVDRVVPLPKRALTLLREHWRRERPSGPFLFESPQHRAHDGEPFQADTVRKALKGAAKEAGINRSVCLHTLRHCYASHLLERGVSLALIQRWLGHKSIRTTMVYAHVTPDSLERGRAILAELTENL